MTIVATLCYIVKNGKVLLIRKKKGFGTGKYNGVGGKVESSETIEEAAIREVKEEVGVLPRKIERAGLVEFYSKTDIPDWIVYIFICRKFEGVPRSSDEAEPLWFPISSLPFKEMWGDDEIWLKPVLEGAKVRGKFWFNENYEELLLWDVVFHFS